MSYIWSIWIASSTKRDVTLSKTLQLTGRRLCGPQRSLRCVWVRMAIRHESKTGICSLSWLIHANPCLVFSRRVMWFWVDRRCGNRANDSRDGEGQLTLQMGFPDTMNIWRLRGSLLFGSDWLFMKTDVDYMKIRRHVLTTVLVW